MAIAEKEEGKPKGQRLFEMSGLAFSFLLSKRDDERVLKPESRNEAGHHPTNQGTLLHSDEEPGWLRQGRSMSFAVNLPL